jgi:hypothetical protein
MFEKELSKCISSLKASKTNQQRVLNAQLLEKCLAKFGPPYLPISYYAQKLIEAGEELMAYGGLFNVADTLSFWPCLNLLSNENAQSESKAFLVRGLQVRAKYGQALVVYSRILDLDPCVQSQDSIKKIQSQVLERILAIMEYCFEGCENAQDSFSPILLLAGSYFIWSIAQFLSQYNHASHLVGSPLHGREHADSPKMCF